VTSQPPSCNVTVVNLVGSALGFVTGLFGKLSAPATTPTPIPKSVVKPVSDEQLLREYQLDTLDPTSDEADDMPIIDENYTRDMYKRMIRHMIRTKRDPGHLVELLDKEEARLKSPEYIEQCRKIKQEDEDLKNHNRIKKCIQDDWEERMSIRKFHNDLDKIKKDLEEKNIVTHPELIKGVRLGGRVWYDNISTAMGSFQEKRMKVFRKDRPDQHPLTPVYDELP
jgi:phage pi2 protein 07